jgi:hypothetical protein
MKKVFSSIALGAILVSGVFFAVAPQADETTQFGGERHPPVLLNGLSDFEF